jgi:hypothetical protein
MELLGRVLGFCRKAMIEAYGSQGEPCWEHGARPSAEGRDRLAWTPGGDARDPMRGQLSYGEAFVRVRG